MSGGERAGERRIGSLRIIPECKAQAVCVKGLACWKAGHCLREPVSSTDIERALRRAEHTEQWYAVRWKRLADELRGTEVWPRVACIMANGTADPTEPRTYDQQMNRLRYERDEANALLAKLIDPEPCWYDHHGYCQEHHLHERPCPHERAKALLAERRFGGGER